MGQGMSSNLAMGSNSMIHSDMVLSLSYTYSGQTSRIKGP